MGWMAPAHGIRVPKLWKRSSNHEPKEPSAMEITTIGLDLAKNVFQVHAVNGASEVVVKKALRRVQMRRFFEQLARAAGRAGAAPHAGPVRQTAHPAGQHDPRPAGGVRH